MLHKSVSMEEFDEYEHCKYCIYFEPTAEYCWCSRHEMRVWDITPKCPDYKGYGGIEDGINTSYEAKIIREKDRKREEYIKILLAGIIGILGVLLGAIFL